MKNPITDDELDKLLNIYCEGIYAMDPKTCLPFWDYDFGPLFGNLWIKRMIKVIRRINVLIDNNELNYKDIAKLFNGVAVPRKELIYSLVDLKVGNIPKGDRDMFVNFWWNIVKEKITNKDYLSEKKTNLVHTNEEIFDMLKGLQWFTPNKFIAKEIGKITMAMNSLSYGLYSDVFAHNCFENFGPYELKDGNIMVIKTWSNLKPVEIWPELKDFKFSNIKIYCIYKNMDYTIDIYNHQWYSANTVENIVKVALIIDDKEVLIENEEKIKETAEYLSEFAVKQFHIYRNSSFEKLKQLWIMQRSYQYKDFFKIADIEWNGEEMKAMFESVKEKKILNEPFWDFNNPKDKLFKFWKKCFDPRLDTYYNQWKQLFEEIVIN